MSYPFGRVPRPVPQLARQGIALGVFAAALLVSMATVLCVVLG